ncbi:MAG: hypothetical protein ACQESF_04255 [Nanobdellota archaeon]
MRINKVMLITFVMFLLLASVVLAKDNNNNNNNAYGDSELSDFKVDQDDGDNGRWKGYTSDDSSVESTFGSKVHTVSVGEKKYKVECGGGLLGGCDYVDTKPDDGEKAKAGIDLAEKAEDNRGEMYELATDGENELTPAENLKKQKSLRDQLAQKGRGKIKAILSSWTENLFGKYLKGFPALICGDSLYRKEEEETETDSEGIFESMMAPESEYKSNMEKRILEDTKTTMLAGEKAQLDKNLYRYAFTMRLIGGPDGGKWTVYLYNSCTKESSLSDFKKSDGKYGWMDHGLISSQEYIGRHYAGGQSASGAGESMVFDCSKESCRFNKVCLKYDDGENICTTLSHGKGFTTEGETGSLKC